MPDYHVVIETTWSTDEDVEPDEFHDALVEHLEEVDLEFEWTSDVTPDGNFQSRDEEVVVSTNCDTIRQVTVTRLEV